MSETGGYAQLDWDEHGQPLSRSYGDVYFSRASGLEETRHVFLQNNQLGERFTALPADGQLVIGETGFGTGLNFLCAWQLFEARAPASATLHFVSVEKFPLTHDDLQRALSLWPELNPYAAELIAQYKAIHPGFQRLLFANGRITLTLLVGDVLEMLPQLDARIDAWFLDGFSPAKNPEMWTPELFAELARLSAADTTLATFTCAGFVRRGLNDAGFAMNKVKGFGHKREMLAGRFTGNRQSSAKPWYSRPATPALERQAIIIGAGLAGCATAASLAARGWRITLLERHGQVAQEGSGNPQGVLYLKLSAHGTALSRLVISGFGHTRRLLERLQPGDDWNACGVLQLAFDDKESKRQQAVAAALPPALVTLLSRSEAEQRAGVALASGGLFFPEAGWLHPPALCRALAAMPGITLKIRTSALRLERRARQWQVLSEPGEIIASAPVIILANAADARDFVELPVKRIRGQVTRVPATEPSRNLQTVLCAEGYVTPARQEQHTLGASFDFVGTEPVTTPEEHASNLELLRDISADLFQRIEGDQLPPEQLQGRAAFRCTAPDYLPIVGPMADEAAFNQAYAVLSKDARQTPDTPCPWLDGLYINTAHGSRGLITAPLCAELLAAWLNDEPLPVPRAIAEACHPNRFLLRNLIRNKH